ncbi:MAG TPA: hypothetical protein VJO13_14540 [Ktedonobacterales bacterium]|nr:hypothetical protein [Ktedonobacterales bacterium]
MRHPPVRNRVDGAIAVIGLPARSGLALTGGLRCLRARFFVVLLSLLQVFVPGYSLGLIQSVRFPFFGTPYTLTAPRGEA